MTHTIYDISRPISPSLPVWTGDRPVSWAWSARIADGDVANVGAISMSVHAGTHADAPLHILEGGAGIAALPLEAFIGPAVVIETTGRFEIDEHVLASVDFERTPRLLFRTGAWTDPAAFPAAWPVLTDAAIDRLIRAGAVLVGMDAPSVDAAESADLPVHHRLISAGVQILESLLLDEVPPGDYELITLPLCIESADGSPVRAVLRRTGHLVPVNGDVR